MPLIACPAWWKRAQDFVEWGKVMVSLKHVISLCAHRPHCRMIRTWVHSTRDGGNFMVTRSWHRLFLVQTRPQWQARALVNMYMLSQETFDHGLLVGEAVLPEYTGHCPEEQASSGHGQEVGSVRWTGPWEWALSHFRVVTYVPVAHPPQSWHMDSNGVSLQDSKYLAHFKSLSKAATQCSLVLPWAVLMG